MYVKNLKALSIVVSAGLFWLVLPLGAQPQTGSVLSRVQTIEDPELGDLIRVAIENCERTSRPPNERLEIVQAVTESYARIKLLDEQIEQTARRAKAGGATEVVGEMVLAKAELESKRMTELGKLRQIMGIIPAHAFGRRSVNELKTWLQLDVIGDRVIVWISRQPFDKEWRRMDYSLAGAMTKNTTLSYVASQLKGEDRLPIRIDIRRTVEGVPLSEQLESEIIQLIKKGNTQMQAEVHLEEVGRGQAHFNLYVENARVGEHWDEPQVPGNHLRRIIDPNDLGAYVERLIRGPTRIPAVFTIEYVPGDDDAAGRVSHVVMETAKRVGIAEFVQVKSTLHEPTSWDLYTGRWEADSAGRVTAIELTLNPIRSVISYQDGRTNAAGNGWRTEGKTLVIGAPETMEGNLDSQGRLVITSGGDTMTFRKVR